MIKNTCLPLAAVFFISLYMLPVSAEKNHYQHPDSVVFKKTKTQEQSNLKSSADQLHERCENLQKEIDELEYKPIRRKAAYERYKAECMRY
jgi:predicted MarR family transcription regulator